MLKEKLAAGETVYGTWVRIPHPSVVEVLAGSGFDFLHIDMEHGVIGIAELDHLLLGARASRIPAVVRVPGLDATRIGGALDMGAAGVIVPQVDRPEETRLVVEAAQFHPRGMRGMAGSCRADGYGSRDHDMFAAESNRDTLLAIQVESREAVENLDAILEIAADDLDVIFIGPADLSQSLGAPARFDDSYLQETIRQVTQRVRSRGLAVGIHAPTPELAKRFADMGIQYIAFSMDSALLATGAKTWWKSIQGRDILS